MESSEFFTSQNINSNFYTAEEVYAIMTNKIPFLMNDFNFSLQDAEDVVSDVFEKLWKKSDGNFSFEKDPTAYLRRCLFNHAINTLRKNKIVTQPLDEACKIYADNRASRETIENEIKSDLRLDELFFSNKIQDISVDELANEKGVTTREIHRRLKKAKESIIETLKNKIVTYLHKRRELDGEY